MNAIWLLLGLLVLSYVGSMLVGDRTIRGFGLPSGAEYLLLGFLLGPQVLGLVSRASIGSFEPVLAAGAAWLALITGVGYGHVGRRPVRVTHALLGIVLAFAVASGVAAAVFIALGLGSDLEQGDCLLLAGAAAAVSCETTRHAVRWVVERHGSKGALSDALADLARASVLVPVLILSVLFAAAPGHGLPELKLLWRAAAPLGIGVMLGVMVTLLLGREFRRDESWGILLGSALLGMGVAARLGLSTMAVTFAMGMAINVLSLHRVNLKALVIPTEKPVMVPMAVLAGALVELEAAGFIPLLVGVALAARVVLELLRGALLSVFLRGARNAGPLLGLGMLSTGGFTLAVAVTVGLRLPGPIGASVVVLAAASVLLGELFGPLMLRRALTQAGNLIPGQSQTPPPPSVDASSRPIRRAP